jgi:CheY-like chemotaxis protein
MIRSVAPCGIPYKKQYLDYHLFRTVAMASSVQSSKYPVLIVDDSAQFRRVLKMIITKGLGHGPVEEVDGPSEALPKIQEGRYSGGIIFVDQYYPGHEDGCSLIRALRDGGNLTNVSAVLMTCEPSPRLLREAREAGAFAMIAKPFDEGVVKNCFNECARLRKFAQTSES